MVFTDLEKVIIEADNYLAMIDVLAMEIYFRMNEYAPGPQLAVLRAQMGTIVEDLELVHPRQHRLLRKLLSESDLAALTETYTILQRKAFKNIELVAQQIATMMVTLPELCSLLQQYGIHNISNEIIVANAIAEVYVQPPEDDDESMYQYIGAGGYVYWMVPREGWVVTSGRWRYNAE